MIGPQIVETMGSAGSKGLGCAVQTKYVSMLPPLAATLKPYDAQLQQFLILLNVLASAILHDLRKPGFPLAAPVVMLQA